MLFEGVAGCDVRDVLDALSDQLYDMIARGCQIALVQLYSIARPPAQCQLRPVAADLLSQFCRVLGERLPGVGIEVFPGVTAANSPAVAGVQDAHDAHDAQR